MTLPLMPKATAVWLVENTGLTFEQIAEFCGMHPLEIQGIADGEVAIGIVGIDPIAASQLTREEIARCEADRKARLQLLKKDLPQIVQQAKGGRYTPIAKRQDKPSAIAWLLRHHQELTDAQVGHLLGTTKSTIQKVRDRSHWDMQNIKPTSPVMLGLCSQVALDDAIEKAARVAERRRKESERAKRRAERARAEAEAAATQPAEQPSE
ncbi:MAG: DUF1013 domain-containing protein [Alphaproteobacteria bacterium]|nr:DUF1013 domain-containing protein [Alphaproteobacteria bacterium]